MSSRIAYTPSWLDPNKLGARLEAAQAAKAAIADPGPDASEAEVRAHEQALAGADQVIESAADALNLAPQHPPKYFLKLASILERDELDGALDGTHRAGEVGRFQLRDVAIAGVRALVDETDADQIIQLIEADYGFEPLPPAEQAQVKEVLEILAKHWPPYIALREQEARRSRILPTLAFMTWVDGWENVTGIDGAPVEYQRNAKGEIPDDVLRRLEPLHIRVVGVEAYRLQYGQSEVKN